MAKRVRPLTDREVQHTKPNDKDAKLFDGGGLFLLVTPAGGKLWRLKYRFNGKEKKLGLGTYPEVSLSEARKRRDTARKQIANGIDPSEARKNEKATATQTVDTFENIAREWIEKFGQNWEPSHTLRKLKRLERDVFPALGNRPIKEITAPELLNILRKIETRGALATAHTIRGIVRQAFDYAQASGLTTHNPAIGLRGALPSTTVKHRPAITDPNKLGPLLRAIDDYDGQLVIKSALRLLPLVFTRPGELRHAEWQELDLETAMWSIPAGRMKMREPHIVPLSNQAVAIFRALQPITGSGHLIFPSIRTTSKPISDNTLNAALRRLGYGTDDVTAHGFRATARTILEEVLNVRTEYVEHQLAHAVKDPLGRAYNRTKHLEERKKMMQVWADYLDTLKDKKKVMP